MESELGRKIQVKLCQLGARLWRNNVAMAWSGRDIIHCGKDIIIKDARPVRAGLCEGSCDYIGFKIVKITPDMVGDNLAVFLGVEIKTDRGRKTIEQERFIRMINDNGGLAFVARSEDDAKEKYEG